MSATVEELKETVLTARQAAQAGRLDEAIELQKTAVTSVRQLEDDEESLVTLSVLLHNLAGYYQDAGQHDAAVTALEEVVAIDERIDHPDLAHDQQALVQARRLAEMTPAELEKLEQQARQAAVRLTSMSQSEQEMARANILRTAMRTLALDVRDAAIKVRQTGQSTGALAARVEIALAQIREETALGDERQELVDYFQAVVAILRQQAPATIPPAYAADIQAILDNQAP
jgi:tetratricopeptide (TPR) repeat protein